MSRRQRALARRSITGGDERSAGDDSAPCCLDRGPASFGGLAGRERFYEGMRMAGVPEA